MTPHPGKALSPRQEFVNRRDEWQALSDEDVGVVQGPFVPSGFSRPARSQHGAIQARTTRAAAHRLCYVRGPEGILIGLAEQIG
jgi:hypothetical protein